MATSDCSISSSPPWLYSRQKEKSYAIHKTEWNHQVIVFFCTRLFSQSLAQISKQKRKKLNRMETKWEGINAFNNGTKYAFIWCIMYSWIVSRHHGITSECQEANTNSWCKFMSLKFFTSVFSRGLATIRRSRFEKWLFQKMYFYIHHHTERRTKH